MVPLFDCVVRSFFLTPSQRSPAVGTLDGAQTLLRPLVHRLVREDHHLFCALRQARTVFWVRRAGKTAACYSLRNRHRNRHRDRLQEHKQTDGGCGQPRQWPVPPSAWNFTVLPPNELREARLELPRHGRQGGRFSDWIAETNGRTPLYRHAHRGYIPAIGVRRLLW